MYELIILIFLILFMKVECASYYSRYGETNGYTSSTNFPYKPASDIANYSPGYGYGSTPGYGYGSSPGYGSTPGYGYGSTPGYGYGSTRGYGYGSTPGYGYGSTPGYTSYSSTRYPGSYGNGYSTNSYNNLYNGGSSGLNNRYGSTYGTGSTYGAGSGYGTGSTYGLGSSYGSGLGSSYGSGSIYGSGSKYGSGYASSYGNYGTQSTVGGYKGYNSYDDPFMRGLGACENRSPQTGINVESLMGIWYGVEYIQHIGTDSFYNNYYDSWDYRYYGTCIVIHISEPRDPPSTEHQLFHVQHINAKFRQDYRHLRLLWDEAGHTSEYALYFRNDTAGYWHIYDGQNGTMTNLPGYQQFGGTVQVLKAVNDHLVLNFCQEGTNMRSPQLYSVLFSRDPGHLNRWEIDSVHSLLQNKKLSTTSRRMVCGNSSATKTMYSLMTSAFMCVFAFFVKS